MDRNIRDRWPRIAWWGRFQRGNRYWTLRDNRIHACKDKRPVLESAEMGEEERQSMSELGDTEGGSVRPLSSQYGTKLHILR